MQADIVTLCHSALAHPDDSLSILGAIGIITVDAVPHLYPHCYFAARLAFDDEPDGEHHLTIRIIDPDGHRLAWTLDADISLDASRGERASVLNIALPIPGMEFRSTGAHAIDLLFDGKLVVRTQFQVAQARQQR